MLRTWLLLFLLFVLALCANRAAAVSFASWSTPIDSSASGDEGAPGAVSPFHETPSPSPSPSPSAPPPTAPQSFFSYTLLPDVKLNIPLNGSVPPNWVGPSIGDFTDSACYRKTHKKNSLGECSQGYNTSGHRCWAQCPISYPVQCFAECIPQNDDCTLELMSKITNPGYVVLNLATAGVFNAIYKSFKTVRRSLMCAFNMFNIAEGISRFMRFRQMMTPNGTKEEILAMVYQTDLFLVDLPVAITACLGYEVPRYAYFTDAVVTAAETMVKQLMINRNLIMSSLDSFLAFFRNSTVGNATDLDAETVSNLTTMIDSGSTCGFELKRLTDRVIAKVTNIRDENPQATNEDIRTQMSKTPIVLNGVPTVTNNCMGELLKTKKPKNCRKLTTSFGCCMETVTGKQLNTSRALDTPVKPAEAEGKINT
ncbi:Potassium voltage-gated channel subfamily A member 5 [Phytophthora cinnamomi]|uniref:Potassium voltage-gated channel subfamily A member 5 n=1 Tax=Phytophthora cinnamomi TaxID=4785 RepID=UPI00355A6D5E|nr:Potassium voltage-gated channel subfamily A member 5 [Phytophthora cinnamomi]